MNHGGTNFRDMIDGDLLGMWQQRRNAHELPRWNQFIRGSLILVAETGRRDIQLREELHRKELFNEHLNEPQKN